MFVENYSLKYGMAMKKFSETHSLDDDIYLKVDSKNIKNKNTKYKHIPYFIVQWFFRYFL